MPTITLPGPNRTLQPYATQPPRLFPPARPPFNRVALAAAHVVADPLADADPSTTPAIDWEATLDYRHTVGPGALGGRGDGHCPARHGPRLADQPGVDPTLVADAHARRGRPIACGAGTDHCRPNAAGRHARPGGRRLRRAMRFVERHGGRIILMARRALTACAAARTTTCRSTTACCLRSASRSSCTGWATCSTRRSWVLGCARPRPGHRSVTCLDRVRNAPRWRASSVAAGRAARGRSTPPIARGVRMYSGDDFHYPELIAGDERRLSACAAGDVRRHRAGRRRRAGTPARAEIDAYTRCSRHGRAVAAHLQAPTRFYKTGVVFIAYLNGHQSHFQWSAARRAPGRSSTSPKCYAWLTRPSLLRDPDDACARMARVLAVHGIG